LGENNTSSPTRWAVVDDVSTYAESDASWRGSFGAIGATLMQGVMDWGSGGGDGNANGFGLVSGITLIVAAKTSPIMANILQ
jgi:hypothetical protein